MGYDNLISTKVWCFLLTFYKVTKTGVCTPGKMPSVEHPKKAAPSSQVPHNDLFSHTNWAVIDKQGISVVHFSVL